MTDTKDNVPKTSEGKSFKEQILAELEKANQLRKQQEEELHQKELQAKAAAKKTAELMVKYEEQLYRDSQESTNHTELNTSEFQSDVSDTASVVEVENKSSLSTTDESSDNANVSGISEYDLADDSVVVRVTEGNMVSDEEEPIFSEDTTFSEAAPTVPDVINFEEDTEKAMSKKDRSKKRRRHQNNSLARRIALYVIASLVVLLMVTAFFVYRYVDSAIKPLDSSSTEYVTVEIPEGSGNRYIGQILEEAGLIKSATIFNYYTKFKNYSDFQSGYYNLQASMDLDEIVEKLQEGGTAEPETPYLGKILVTEGFTIEQIAEAVTKNVVADDDDDSTTPFTADDFLSVVQDETFISEMVAKYPTLLADLPSSEDAVYRLEGYLFPATYNYYDGTTVQELIEEMIATMDTYMSDYYDTISANGMTVNEVLTLASLVEKEGSTDEDRRNIASVFYNRLNSGMPLQSNIAILYAMGDLGEETTLAEDASVDTSIDSPYNVYTNTGLMPGPVASPSLSAIEATVNPASTDYYYFVADVTTGTVYYAETYDEHSENVDTHVNSKLTE